MRALRPDKQVVEDAAFMRHATQGAFDDVPIECFERDIMRMWGQAGDPDEYRMILASYATRLAELAVGETKMSDTVVGRYVKWVK